MRGVGNCSKKYAVLTAIITIIIADTSAYFMMLENKDHGIEINNTEKSIFTNARNSEPWYGDDEAWSQFGKNPNRNSSTPLHFKNMNQDVNPSESSNGFGSITDPIINWQSYVDSDGDVGEYGIRGYGTAIGNFSNQINRPITAIERCGENHLFSVFVARKSSNSGNDWLIITEGDTNKEVWRVDLGPVNNKGVKSTPMIYDLGSDGSLEIILAFDTESGLTVEVWSPEIKCTDSGWQLDGHTTEILWTLTDADHKLEGPNVFINNGHSPTTQSLIADLEMDGSPEVILSAININSENPTVIAIPLTTQGPPDPLWEVELDRGTHPSDPAWVALDEQTSAILLTTIDANNGNMWAWRISGSTGSVDWDGLSLGTPDGDTNTPHIRLPGPVIVELDGDITPEVLFTVPSDFDGSSNADGASFHAWELTDANEIWSFRSQTGFADAPPLPVDGNKDGIHESICWITWYLDGTFGLDRHAKVGCHDVLDGSPEQKWINSIDYDGNVPNEGIAVAQPIAMDLDGTGAPEIIIAYGNTLIDFDGENGFKNQHWDSSLSFNHRTWASPSTADLDGDGYLDILIGDIMVSQSLPDIVPYLDGRGIQFSPSESLIDPGASVTISGQFQNQGTISVEEPLDAILMHNGNIIATHRVVELDPISPSGDGSVVTFSTNWVAELGSHEFKLIIDPFNNITQSRYDNDNYTTILEVTAPYELAMALPPNQIRIDPGSSESIEIDITAVGRTTGEWSMELNTQNMPENWTVIDATPNGSSSITLEPDVTSKFYFDIFVPGGAGGRDVGSFTIKMSLDSDTSINRSLVVPIEVNLTQGISAIGPRGTSESSGIGMPGQKAKAWFMVENLGNAQETISIQWSSGDWGTPTIVDSNDQTYFTITLPANGKYEFLAQINVLTSNLGESVQNKLTLCIDASVDEICKEIDFTFTSNGISISPPHVRSNPLQDLSWEFKGEIPNGLTDVEWEMNNASMLQSGWIWSAEGDLSADSNTITLSGNSGENVQGWLNLTLPEYSPPQLHEFQADAIGLQGHSIDFTLQILQYYRSEIEVVSPIEQPLIVDVNTETQVVLRLQNTGNGEDTFWLNAKFQENENFSSDPGVIFEPHIQEISLGVQTTKYATLKITLPDNTDARKGLKIKFTLESQGNASSIVSTNTILEARQDHRWDFTLISSSNITEIPSELVSFNFEAKNVGNYNDTLNVDVTTSILHIGNDTSIWNINNQQLPILEVNETNIVSIEIVVPIDAWNGTIATIEIVTTSINGEIMSSKEVFIEVKRTNGWIVNLESADLDINPEGDYVTLEIMQLGNYPSTPYIIPVLSNGWTTSINENMSSIDPLNSFTYNLQITPPDEALSGEISSLGLIVKNANGGLGRTEIQIPLRVESQYSFIANNNEEWLVNEEGGAPVAWITNSGNALTTINADVNIPNGWSVSGELNFTLSAGQTKGIDIILTPPSTWNEETFDVTIKLSDSHGNMQNMTIPVTASAHTWAKSPIFIGIQNDLVELKLKQSSTITSISSSADTVQRIDNKWWIKLDSEMSNVLTISDSLETTTSKFEYIVIIPQSREVNCQFKSSTLLDMEDRTFDADSIIASCDISNGTSDFRWSALITTNSGELITHIVGITYSEEVQNINLTSNSWTPNVGSQEITVTILDRQGNSIETKSYTLIARKTGWNIGVSSVEQSVSNQDIILNIGLSRINYQIMDDVTCTLSATGTDWNSQWDVDITGGTFAPVIMIYNPPVNTGDEILFDISCAVPWDIDDNPSDDQATYIMKDSTVASIVSGNTIWTAGTAVIIIGVAWFLGMLWPTQKRKVIRKERTTNRQEVKKIEKITEELEEESISLESSSINSTSSEIEQTSLSAKAEIKAKEIESAMAQETEMDAAPPESIANLNTDNEENNIAKDDIDSRIEDLIRRRKR